MIYVNSQFIYESLGINSEEIPTFWKNSKLTKSADGTSEKDHILGQLYATVPRETLIKVYRKYKFDYEMFGFDFDFDNVLRLANYSLLTESEKAMSPHFY